MTSRVYHGRAALWSGRFILLCLAVTLACSMAWAGPYSVDTVPNVRLTDKTNHVSNPDGLISPEDAAAINKAAAGLEQSLGIEVAVVAVKSIGDNEARMFATELFNHWGLGKKGKDNGLLIQLVTEPPNRSIVFETGYGLEGVLPDAICYRLQQRYMVPQLKQGEYSAAMARGVTAVAAYLTSQEPAREAMTALPGDERAREETDPASLLLIPALILLLFLYRRNPAAFGAILGFILGSFRGGGGRGGFGGGSGGGGSWGGGSSGGGGSMSRF